MKLVKSYKNPSIIEYLRGKMLLNLFVTESVVNGSIEYSYKQKELNINSDITDIESAVIEEYTTVMNELDIGAMRAIRATLLGINTEVDDRRILEVEQECDNLRKSLAITVRKIKQALGLEPEDEVIVEEFHPMDLDNMDGSGIIIEDEENVDDPDTTK